MTNYGELVYVNQALSSDSLRHVDTLPPLEHGRLLVTSRAVNNLQIVGKILTAKDRAPHPVISQIIDDARALIEADVAVKQFEASREPSPSAVEARLIELEKEAESPMSRLSSANEKLDEIYADAPSSAINEQFYLAA